MTCEIHYINEGITYPQGVVRSELRDTVDSISFTTDRKWLCYFFEGDETMRQKAIRFLKNCFKYGDSFRLYVERPEGWSSEWVVKGFETLQANASSAIFNHLIK